MEQSVQPPTQKKKNGCLTFASIGCLTIIGLFILLGVLGSLSLNSAKEKAQQHKQEQDTQQANNTAQDSNVNQPVVDEAQKEITYEIKRTWDIPNGGHGKTVVISKDYLNDADMATLGDKLRSDSKDDRNAFIFVYTDATAAELRDKPLEEITDTESDLILNNFVGTYTKNANSGYDEFAIYYDGQLGTNTKTIKY